MTPTFLVEYQEGQKRIEISLPGPLLITTKLLKIKEKRVNHVVLEQDRNATSKSKQSEESRAPDILVGSIPLIYLDDDRVTPKLTYLKIPPPPPFDRDDIEIMWNKIHSQDIPTPNSIALQGRYGPGSTGSTSSKQITAEFLNYAHQQCRYLLTHWPTTEAYELVQRNIELRGGREDFLLTERQVGSRPIYKPQGKNPLPQHTVRRRSSNGLWRSPTLSRIAANVADLIQSHETKEIFPSGFSNFIRHFTEVAKLAKTNSGFIDPPVSTWPSDAHRCYESLLAVKKVLQADDQGKKLAPLANLWRLYEAWIAAVCLETTVQKLGNTPLISGLTAEGCEWIANWQLSNDRIVTLMAQPRITNNELKISHEPIFSIRSISSDLRPDVLITISSKDSINLVVIDAKKRSPSTTMEAAEVAETGCKYIWGIRASSTDTVIVRSAIIASTMQPGTMHETLARIKPIRVIPRHTDEIRNAIHQEIDNILAESL